MGLTITYLTFWLHFRQDRTIKKQQLAHSLAEFMVGKMNDDLETNNASHLCAELTLGAKANVSLLEWEPDQDTGVYKVTYTVQPSGGRFWGYAQVL